MKLTSDQKTKIHRVLAFIVVFGISVLVIVFSDKVESLGAYGYPGLFIFSIFSSATVILPAPGLILVFSMGAVLNPVGVSLAAGFGAAIGELSGYLAGFSGQGIVENTKVYERVHLWMETNPKTRNLYIMVMAFIPNPLFDMAGMAAGALRIPLIPFLFWVSIGKILKMLIVAYLGDAWLVWPR